MSWVPAERVLQTIGAQRQVLAAEDARIANFANYHAAERAKLEAEKAQAVHDFGQALLPRLDHASITAAANAVGLVGIVHEDIPNKLEGRRRWLAHRLADIARDPRFADRELLRHPRTGSLTTAILQNEELRKPAADVIAACEANPRWESLWTSNYGTPQHAARWWRYSYWQDRSAADALVAAFGKQSFEQVRDEYARAKETVAVFDGEIAGLRYQIAAGIALEREHATLHEEHRTLDARGLEHTRQRLVAHALGTDASLVSQRLRGSPQTSELVLLFLRASGIVAKIAYLDGIQQKHLAEMQRDVHEQRKKLDAVETRTRKRWAPLPMDKYQKLSVDRRPWYEKRWQRFGKTYTTIHVYDRWDRGRYYEDLLWWDLMTRGRYDGSFLPDVAEFHHRHPGYQYDPDWKSRAAAERAARDADDADDGPDEVDTAARIMAVESMRDRGDAGSAGGDDSPDITTTDAS
jgi:hypothetical protein